MRSIRLLVVWTVVLAPIVGMPLFATDAAPPAAPDDAGTVKQAVDGKLSYLAINRTIEHTDTSTVFLDSGSALSMSTSQFEYELEIQRIKNAYENASNKQAFVERELDDIENQTEALRERQNTAIRGYNEEKLSSRLFLRELALISADARRIQVSANYFTERENITEKNAGRANNIKQELNIFHGIVRGKIRSALNGDPDAPKRYFVQTSTNGVVLATIEDEDGKKWYLREAYLGGARGSSNGSQFNAAELKEKLGRLYPEVKPIRTGGSSLVWLRYEFRLSSFFDGVISTQFDRRSGEIVFEKQKIPIDDENTVHGQTKNNGSFALTTSTTYPGGYMYVRLTENGNDRNGTISVDGETIGSTGGEELLMLQPSNGTTITGTSGNKSVSITVGASPNSSQTQPPIKQRQSRMFIYQ